MTSTSPMEESRGKAYVCGDNGKLGLRQRSRMTHEESRGEGLCLWGQWESWGLRCIDRGKEARSGDDQGVQGEGLRCGDSRKAGTQVYRSGMDSVCERTLDELPTDGFEECKSVCHICGIVLRPVLSAELC